MTMPSIEFYRLDSLTGCNNFLSFVETLEHMSTQEEKSQFSILYTDLNRFYELNETKGHVYGDSVVRWLGIVLQEESHLPVYRISGDDFAVILTDGSRNEREELLERLFARVCKEGKQLDLSSPPAKIALIHFDDNLVCSITDVIFHLWETIYDVKKNKSGTVSIFEAQDLLKSTTKAEGQSHENLNRLWDVLQFIANNAIGGFVGMGQKLDIAQQASYLDSISGLPNMRAALLKMDQAIKDAVSSNQPFSILLIDGDNLRKYNSISYAAGDTAIQNIGAVLSKNLRPGDFVARWRTGDEFIVILPNTFGEGARVVAERFRSAIREASRAWNFPTSISIGIATYPKHGDKVNALVDVAEMANKQAKDEGKDRVILAE